MVCPASPAFFRSWILRRNFDRLDLALERLRAIPGCWNGTARGTHSCGNQKGISPESQVGRGVELIRDFDNVSGVTIDLQQPARESTKTAMGASCDHFFMAGDRIEEAVTELKHPQGSPVVGYLQIGWRGQGFDQVGGLAGARVDLNDFTGARLNLCSIAAGLAQR